MTNIPSTETSPDEALQLPEEFTYVCIASGQPQVNLVPFFALGANRVKHVIIIRGMTANPSAAEVAQAQQPADRLRQFFLDRQYAVEIITGHPDRVVCDAWGKVAARAKNVGLPIIANLTGGPKQVAFGIDAQLSKLPNYYRLFVGKYPDDCWLISATDPRHEHRIPPAGYLPLADAVAIRGLRLLPEDTIRRNLREWNALDEYLNGLRDAIWPDGFAAPPAPDAVQTIALLNSYTGQINDNNPRLSLRGAGGQLSRGANSIIELFSQGRDVFIDGIVDRQDWLRMVCGSWLELIIRRALIDGCAGMHGLEFLYSVALAWRGERDEVREIDIMIRKGGQLHLVEVKGSVDIKLKVLTGYIATLAATRQQTAGTVKAWLILPFAGLRGATAKEANRRAQAAGVILLHGDKAISGLIAEVLALA